MPVSFIQRRGDIYKETKHVTALSDMYSILFTLRLYRVDVNLTRFQILNVMRNVLSAEKLSIVFAN